MPRWRDTKVWGSAALLSVSLLTSGFVSAESSPLERLKERSASTRWSEARQEFAKPATSPTKIEQSVPKQEPAATPESAPAEAAPSESGPAKVELKPSDETSSSVGVWKPAEKSPTAAEPVPDTTADVEAEPTSVQTTQFEGTAPSEPSAPSLTATPEAPADESAPEAPAAPVLTDVGRGDSESTSPNLPVPDPYEGGSAIDDWTSEFPMPLFASPVPSRQDLPLEPAKPNTNMLVPAPPIRFSQVPGDIPPAPMSNGRGLSPVPQPNGVDEGLDVIFRPITQIEPNYDYSPTGTKKNEYLCPQPSDIPEADRERCPDVRELPKVGSTDRYFGAVRYQWAAGNAYYNPLYFEDVALERYGHVYPGMIQPFVSLGKFGVDFLALPYTMAIDPICRHEYPLGHYRPGENVPKMHYQVPWNTRAAATAAGVYTGLFFLFP